mgnify:CR=1 FL=1
MGSFSNLIDISSFFIGVLINLLLVALVCYYFKRKIDNLELSQSEQAKMLYSLISRQEQQNLVIQQENKGNESQLDENNMNFLQNLDLNSLGTTNNFIVSQEEDKKIVELNNENITSDEESDDERSEEESEDESDDEETEEEQVTEEEVVEEEDMVVNEEEVKSIQYNEIEPTSDYDFEKMTIKELKTVIESKGLTTKKNSKKQELIEVLVQELNKEKEEVLSIEKIQESEIVEDSESLEESNEIELEETELVENEE